MSSSISQSIHKTVKGLQKSGVISTGKARKYYSLCLTKEQAQ